MVPIILSKQLMTNTCKLTMEYRRNVDVELEFRVFDGVAMLYVYKKIKTKITPKINAKVDDTLNEWFGVEYELVS